MLEDSVIDQQSSEGWLGEWWLPNRQDKKLPGRLYPYTERGPRLELTGRFHDGGDLDYNQLDIIHGVTSTAGKVTVHNCMLTGWSTSLHRQDRIDYEVELVATGDHFASVDSLVFRNLQLGFSTLGRWVRLPVIETSQDSYPLNLKVRTPITVPMYNGTDFALTLLYGPVVHMIGGGVTVEIHADAYVILKWKVPRKFNDSLDVAQRIRDFLTFATTIPTEIESIKVTPEQEQYRGFPHDTRLFHKLVRRSKKDVKYWLPLFSYVDVAKDVRDVTTAWFDKAELLQPVVDLHLSPIYNPQMREEGQFLAVVQALEAFHRRTRDKPDLPEDAHRARMLELVKSTPQHYRRWLVEQLRYSNEQKLRARIKSVFDEFRDILDHFNLERKRFIHHTCITRNYLTHYDHRLVKEGAEGAELRRLTNGLQLLLEICLLHELGIQQDTIFKLTKKRHLDLASSG